MSSMPPEGPAGPPARVLVVKTGALGDVLRSTALLAALERRHPAGVSVTWLTARGARPLLEGLVRGGELAELLDTGSADAAALEGLTRELAARGFDRVLSLDDEEPLCRLASAVAGEPGRITGACLDADGARTYTDDAAPWFDMGLLSRFGKGRADELKVANRRSHPDLLAEVVGAPLAPGQEPDAPRLRLDPGALAAAAARLPEGGPRLGLNTGAGGRWTSKALPEERVVALAEELVARHPGARLVLLGGPEEADRNARLAEACAHLPLWDAGTDNDLEAFGALVAGLDLVVTSDSLALHLAVASRVPVVAFFAPTSAAEIELYGRGEKVASTAQDACSYRPDADTSTLTVARLAAAVDRVLAAGA